MPVAPSRIFAWLRRFHRSEDGSMIVFGLFLFVMMLIVAGLAVDVMRFETQRTRLQGTLDRAVLAAAELDQTRDPQTVVRDYFASAGLLDGLNSVTVNQAINSREVTADARLAVNTMFMDWVGVEQLRGPAASTAEEAVNDIEIVLVLDVSGSMSEASGGSTKIRLLRSAAQEFVSTVRQNDAENRISIAIVPFNAQVNLGPTIFNGMVSGGYSITDRHGMSNSSCLDLPPSAYSQPAIPRPTSLPQAGHFGDVSTTTKSHTGYTAPQAISTGNVYCRTEAANFAHLPSQDVATMRSQLQALSANGNTSITMGMKYANFMLDPSTRPFFANMVGPGPTQISETLEGRRYDYNRPNTRKVIVVMTDGEHVSSLYLNPGFRTEMSPIFRMGTAPGNYQYSILLQPPARAALGSAYQPYRYWVSNMNVDGGATTTTWPTLSRDGTDNDFDRVVDDGIVGGWRPEPWDGTIDRDTDGPQYLDGVLVAICDDDNKDGRDDVPGAGPCDDDDFNDDGIDDGDDQDGDVDVDGGSPVTQLRWNEVWRDMRVSWVAWHLYARGWCGIAGTGANDSCRNNTYNTVMNVDRTSPIGPTLPRFMSATDVGHMNDTLQQSCRQARSHGVIIYGIALEAPSAGRRQIVDCTGEPGRFYDSTGPKLSEAFQLIAAQIVALRLTR